MGFFSNLFNHFKSDAALEKVARFLNDDDFQIELIPAHFRSLYNPTPMDSLPDGIGEFGRDPRNPIPCNGPIGELTYLSKLVIPLPDTTNMRITFHRLGSRNVSGRDIDIYEIISYDGLLYDILCLDMYHYKKSRLCPKGYAMESVCTGLRGTNHRNDNFPYNQYDCVRECSKNIIGVPAFDTKLKKGYDYEHADEVVKLGRELGPDVIKWW